jgi:hypothetical protein
MGQSQRPIKVIIVIGTTTARRYLRSVLSSRPRLFVGPGGACGNRRHILMNADHRPGIRRQAPCCSLVIDHHARAASVIKAAR